MNRKNFKIYLAGPITNCNEKQRSAWRKRMKEQLKAEGLNVLDPTVESARKGALAVTADIEEADVVIANLWKESVGTVIGIVQARGSGIPVILIDQHYIDSPVLASMVEPEHVVRDEFAAVNLLKNHVIPALNREIRVEKKDGRIERFELRKLQNSSKAALMQAGIDDPIFHILISRRTYRAILDPTKKDCKVSTKDIKRLLLTEIQKLCEDGNNSKALSKSESDFIQLKEQWDIHQDIIKPESTDRTAYLSELESEVEVLSEEVTTLTIERDNLAAQLKTVRFEIQASSSESYDSNSLIEGLRSILGDKKGVCISNLGKTSFRYAFERHGIPENEFEELFEEQILDGKQSNLNQTLEIYVKSARVVLYAGDGLRHLHSNLREAENLISGCGPNDCIRRLLSKRGVASLRSQ